PAAAARALTTSGRRTRHRSSSSDFSRSYPAGVTRAVLFSPAGRPLPTSSRSVLRRRAPQAVVQAAFDRIAVEVEHPQLVVGHHFVQPVLGFLAVGIQADALAGLLDRPGAGAVVGGAVAFPVRVTQRIGAVGIERERAV